ncbi:MAG TPA: SPFH domain-containing protein [Rhodanobacteraceae bacterium]
MTISLTILAVLALIAVTIACSIKHIPEGQVYTLRRFGKPAGTLSAGTHLVVPLIESIAHKISIAGYTLAVDERLADADAAAAMQGRVWWQVLDPERVDAVIDRADDMIRRQLRDAVQRADVAGVPDPRSRNQRIKQTLNGSLRARGVLVTRVELNLAA